MFRIYLLYSGRRLSEEDIHAIIFELTCGSECSDLESTDNWRVEAEPSTCKGLLNNATADDESIQFERNHW